MDGASRLFGTPRNYPLGGREWELLPTIAEYYGEMEAQILSRRPDPFKAAREAMAEFAGRPDAKEIRDYLLALAMDKATAARYASTAELAGWLATIDGQAFQLWLHIRHNDESLTHAQVRTWMLQDAERKAEALFAAGLEKKAAEDLAAAEVVRKSQEAVNQVDGTDELGNSTGPPPTGAGLEGSPGGG